jgi:hypothetical protein
MAPGTGDQLCTSVASVEPIGSCITTVDERRAFCKAYMPLCIKYHLMNAYGFDRISQLPYNKERLPHILPNSIARRLQQHLIWGGTMLGHEIGRVHVDAASKGYLLTTFVAGTERVSIYPIDIDVQSSVCTCVGIGELRAALMRLPHRPFEGYESNHERVAILRRRAHGVTAGS